MAGLPLVNALRGPLLAAMTLLLAGCGTVGLRDTGTLPELDGDFDAALLAYARGDLDAAQRLAVTRLEVYPLDLRARDLLRAILEERGELDDATGPGSEVLPPFSPETPRQTLELSVARSPAVREAVFAVVEARARMREANLSISPEFTVLTRFYPLGILARLTQSVHGGLRERKARLVAEEGRMLEALAAYGQAVEVTRRDALVNYLAVQRARREQSVLERRLQLLGERRAVFDALAMAGHRLADDVARADAGIAAAETEMARSRRREAVASARLNGLLDREPKAGLQLSAATLNIDVPADIDAAIDTAYENRFDLAERRAAVASGEARYAVARAMRPRIDGFVAYGESDEPQDPSILEGPTVGAVTRVPVMYLPQRRAEAARFMAYIRQLEMRERQLRFEVSSEVIDRYHAVAASTAAAAQARRVHLRALETDRIAGQAARYDGASGPAQRLDAQLEVTEAELQLIQRHFELQEAYALAAAAVGVIADGVDGTERFPADYPGPAAAAASGDGALWVWQTDTLLVPGEAAFFAEFLTVRGFQTVFLFTSVADLARRPAAYRDLLSQLARRGIDVHALNGEAGWAGRPSAVSEFIGAVLRFNRGAAEFGFTAAHLDIEPHALDAWQDPARRPALLAALRDTLAGAREQAAAGGLQLVADLPVWYAEQELDGGNALGRLANAADGVAVMAYGARRERVQAGISALGGTALPAGLWIGLSADPRHLCAPAGYFEYLADVDTARVIGADSASFSGVAVHDYRRLTTLLLSAGDISAAPVGRKCNRQQRPRLTRADARGDGYAAE